MQAKNIFSNSSNFLAKISWLGASSIIKYIVQIITIILFANKLSVKDYASYQHVWIVINLFCTIIPFGLSALLLNVNTGAIKNWIFTNKQIVITSVIVGIIALLFYLFFIMSNFENTEKVFLFLFIIIQIITLIGEAILTKQGKEKTIFWINTFYFIAYLLLHYFIVIKFYNLATLLLGLIIITIVKAFFLFMLKNRIEKIIEEDKTISKEWIYLGTNDLLNTIVKWLDKWIILWLWPTASFAVYFNGTYEIPIFLLLLGAVGSVSIVEISKLKLEENQAILQLFKKPVLTLATILLPSFAFLFCNASYLFEFLFSNKYNESVPIFLITLLILPARVVYSTSVLQVFGKSKIIVQGVIIDLLLAIFFMAILYPSIGIKGFALAFVLSTYIQIFYYLWHTSRLLRLKFSKLLPFSSILIILILSIVFASSLFALTTKLPHLYALMINSFGCIFNIIVIYFLFAKAKNN